MPMNPIRRDVKPGSEYSYASQKKTTVTRARDSVPLVPTTEPIAERQIPKTLDTKVPDVVKGSNPEMRLSPSENKAPNGVVIPRLQKKVCNTNTRKREKQSKAPRRTIFNQLRKEEDSVTSNDDSATACCERPQPNILEFSPPMDHRYELQKRFKLLDSFPLEKTQELPPLPTPLLRYTGEGFAATGGVYPLVEPVSILREGKYSPRRLGRRDDFSSTSSSNSDDEDSSAVDENSTSNDNVYWSSKVRSAKTDARHRQRLCDFERIARDLKDVDDAKRFLRRQTESTDEPDHEPLVKFDPRIVITEFPDDTERDWFSEDELNRFKHETIMLVRHYIMLHPEYAEEYNTPKINPITGKVQKKALYALPGLCSADGMDSPGSSTEIESLLKNAVQKILIVDPNKAILDLFQKSMNTLQMFPNASVTLVQSGEEALRVYTAELEDQKNRWDGCNGGFDIVIVEEQLSHHRVKRCGKRSAYHSARMVRMNSDSSAYLNSSTALGPVATVEPTGNGMPKPDSLFNLQSVSSSPGRDVTMTGSRLIKLICQVEERFYKAVPEDANDSSVISPPQRCSLVIGVSVNLEKDSQKLKDSGADLVWGKPPPTMGEELRNKLVSALIAKRHKASFCIDI